MAGCDSRPETCHGCGRSGAEDVQDVTHTQFQMMLNRAKLMRKHVMENHPEFLHTGEGQAWLQQSTMRIDNMKRRLLVIAVEEDARSSEVGAQPPPVGRSRVGAQAPSPKLERRERSHREA